MATYTSLHNLVGHSTAETLMQQITIALVIKANTIAKNASATVGAKTFAINVLRDPKQYLQTCLYYIIAEYNTIPVSGILAATDEQVQIAVNAAVDTLLGV